MSSEGDAVDSQQRLAVCSNKLWVTVDAPSNRLQVAKQFRKTISLLVRNYRLAAAAGLRIVRALTYPAANIVWQAQMLAIA